MPDYINPSVSAGGLGLGDPNNTELSLAAELDQAAPASATLSLVSSTSADINKPAPKPFPWWLLALTVFAIFALEKDR